MSKDSIRRDNQTPGEERAAQGDTIEGPVVVPKKSQDKDKDSSGDDDKD